VALAILSIYITYTGIALFMAFTCDKPGWACFANK